MIDASAAKAKDFYLSVRFLAFACLWMDFYVSLVAVLFISILEGWRWGHLWRRCVSSARRWNAVEECMSFAQPIQSTNKDRECRLSPVMTLHLLCTCKFKSQLFHLVMDFASLFAFYYFISMLWISSWRGHIHSQK